MKSQCKVVRLSLPRVDYHIITIPSFDCGCLQVCKHCRYITPAGVHGIQDNREQIAFQASTRGRYSICMSDVYCRALLL